MAETFTKATTQPMAKTTVVTTIGQDLALVTTEFAPDGQTGVGRQSQTWLRIDGAWRVVTAHVSWLPA